MKINPLTNSEEHLMHIIWTLKSAYLKDIMEQLPEPKPHQNTISTFLKILVEKGFLNTKKEGRIFNYQVAIPFEDYKKYKLNDFLANFYNHSATKLLQDILSEKLIAEDDLQKIFHKKSRDKSKKEITEQDQFIEDELKKIHKKKKKEKKKKR